MKTLNEFKLADLKAIMESGDKIQFHEYLDQFNLKIENGAVTVKSEYKEQWEFHYDFLDKRQLVRKILLNSCYGALLNQHMRFYDHRIGQSTTLNGRQIVKHMSAHINEQICGVYDHAGEAIIYGDTDSAYFSAYSIIRKQVESGELEWNKETAVSIYDTIADNTNESFPDFMARAFHCPHSNGAIIKAGRELVGDRGIFMVKKRYAINIYDKEGKRLDVNGKLGKIKAMGLDLKRADTPKHVQQFLTEVLEDVLAGAERDAVIAKVRDFKIHLKAQPSYTLGSPKGVNKLNLYTEQIGRGKKVNLPGHVSASMNWNQLRKLNNDNYSMKILDGMKIVVCKLRSNILGMTSIAYPTDELRLPEWFLELPFDRDEMIKTLVDEKIENLLGALNWKLREDINTSNTFNSLFKFV